MKHTLFPSPATAPLAIALILGAPIMGIGQETVIPADQISRQVVNAAASRSFAKNVRKGFQYGNNSRSIAVESRSLVEVEIPVDPGANISIPINFVLNKSDQLVPGNAERQLAELAKALAAAPVTDQYLIEGHTCVKGELDHNNRLSIARANYIVSELAKRGVKATLTPIGCGPAEAAAQRLTPQDEEARLAPYRKVILHKVAQ